MEYCGIEKKRWCQWFDSVPKRSDELVTHLVLTRHYSWFASLLGRPRCTNSLQVMALKTQVVLGWTKRRAQTSTGLPLLEASVHFACMQLLSEVSKQGEWPPLSSERG